VKSEQESLILAFQFRLIMSNILNIRNKKASFDYELIEKFIAGVQLTGTEIKSVREGKVSLADAYCVFFNNELYVRGMNVSEYSHGSFYNHDPRRDRKLLLNRKELNKLFRKSQDKGQTIVAIRLFLNEKGLAKLEIALARGKREFDKRETLRQKDDEREMDRIRKR
jgi:SsrA-binding protein